MCIVDLANATALGERDLTKQIIVFVVVVIFITPKIMISEYDNMCVSFANAKKRREIEIFISNNFLFRYF